MPNGETAGGASGSHTESLSSELALKLLERLVLEWEGLNWTYFKDALRTPVFSLSPSRKRLGQWDPVGQRIDISRHLVLEHPWTDVLEVLKHEMVHQFVDTRLHVDEPPHGPTFRDICARLGIAAGPSVDLSSGNKDDPAHKMIDRVRKLLALADSPNQHEAEVAATAARRLMLKFNVDISRTHNPSPCGFRHLGTPSGRIFEHQRILSAILLNYFFVECVWIQAYRPKEGKRGSVLEICGDETNLMMAEHVHAFLLTTADRMWSVYRSDNQIRGNRDRLSYLAGVMRGFAGKLRSQQEIFEEEGLVWVPTSDLSAYFRRRHPRTSSTRMSGNRRNEAYMEGQRAGGDIVLSQPVSDTGQRTGPVAALRSAAD